MIKLNNKSITYVALADSSNSLKTPKEIWYADSNNSVKLVYQRKDALVEGVDYEKYHWLKGDGSAYIDTLVKNLTNANYIDLFISVAGVDYGNHKFFGRESVAPYYNSQVVLYYVPDRQNISVWGNSVGHEINFADIVGNVTLNFNTNIASTPTDSVNFSISNYNSAFSIFLFATNSNGNAISPFIGKIKKLEIDNILYLIPCKLLKPVPKWLDANGIRRQVGECGMIDLVSGKFYGNVNSVGTFTVENYYERKEWLVGDGTAFLNTNGENALIGINSVEWELSGNGQAVLNSFGLTTGAAQFVSDLSYVDGSIGKIGIYDNNRGYFWTTKLNVNTLRLVSGTTIKAITINDVDLSNPNYQWNGNFILQFINRAAGYKVSKVTVDGSVRYIPCTLTMDLPASMDANNIARTKGTSGMWDLVSDRFYGNVANSGTFKAVNLAEGVDYEVHQWLRIDVNTMQSTQMMTLPINSYQFSFKRKWLRQSTYAIHSLYFAVEGYAYFTNQNIKMLIWDGANATHIYNSGTKFNLGDTITINCNAENYNFDGISMPIYGVCGLIALDCSVDDKSVGADIAFSTSSVTVDGIERYIPVKLLRSIPSKYDANGIARQAGECGMYDTVNDKFYGNVASSGSFTVSDDN